MPGSSTPSSPAPDAPAPATTPSSDSSSPSFSVGDLVVHSYRDDYRGAGGEDVSDYGFVVEIVDVEQKTEQDPNAPTVQRPRVAWLREVSDPIDPDALTAAK